MIYRFLFLLFALNGFLFGQEDPSDLSRVRSLFQNFEYRGVVTTADSIIQHSTTFDSTARLELLRMKGIAEYSLKEQDQAQYTFLEILRLDNNYVMDPFDTPPKILELFNIIKTSYNSRPVREKVVIKTDSVVYTPAEPSPALSSALIRSVIIPGWGHFSYKMGKKGSWLTIGTFLTLAPAIYFSWDSFNKEKKYLNETDNRRIESRYDDFNTSYQLRNLFLLSYACLWLYAQMDVLHLHSEQHKFSRNLEPIPTRENRLVLGIRLHF